MMVILITALYMLIFLWVSWRYLRTREPLLRDVTLIFATMAMLFVLGLSRLLLGEPPRVAGFFGPILFWADPCLPLRLVSRLRRVPLWLLATVAAAWAVSAVVVMMFPDRLPRQTVWPL